MKNLDVYGVQELNAVEMIGLNGGNPLKKWIWDYTLGKLVDYLIENLPEAMEEYSNTIQEGGTTSTQMPFP